MSYGGDDQPDSEQEPTTGAGREFERQELIDMVHEMRGVTPGAEPEQQTPKRPTRITHHEIKAMKVTVRKEDSPFVGLFRQIGGLFSGFFLAIAGFFSGRPARISQCQMNGHTFPKHWKGDFPKCKHCGTVIRHPDEIKTDK